MDDRIRRALYEAAKARRQSAELAGKLASWFEAISSGNEDVANPQHSGRRLDLIFGEVRFPSPQGRYTPTSGAARPRGDAGPSKVREEI